MSYLTDKIKSANKNQNPALAKEIRKNLEYENELNSITSFLNEFNVTTSIRMWYVKNEVSEVLRCKNCDKPLDKVLNFCRGACAPIYYNRNKTEEQIKNKSESISNNYRKKTEEEKKFIKINRKNTIKTKYGVEHNFLIPGVYKKIQEKNFKKYGNIHATKNEKVKEKIKRTNNLKYGGNSPTSSLEIRAKVKDTMIKKYGVECPCFFQYKEYFMPSGKIVKYQGYENKAFDILLEKYGENYFTPIKRDIFETTGRITYINKDGKTSTYYPDILIKSENKIIEVKSPFTFNINKENNLLKKQACINLGFLFEFWILEENNKLTIIK